MVVGKKNIKDMADIVEYLNYDKELCPDCNCQLEKKGYQDRTVIDSENKKLQEDFSAKTKSFR